MRRKNCRSAKEVVISFTKFFLLRLTDDLRYSPFRLCEKLFLLVFESYLYPLDYLGLSFYLLIEEVAFLVTEVAVFLRGAHFLGVFTVLNLCCELQINFLPQCHI